MTAHVTMKFLKLKSHKTHVVQLLRALESEERIKSVDFYLWGKLKDKV